MSQMDLMKLFSQFDGEISLSDFSPEELEQILAGDEANIDLKRKYFEFYNDVKSSSLKKQDW